jgi:general secretion pathway protein A
MAAASAGTASSNPESASSASTGAASTSAASVPRPAAAPQPLARTENAAWRELAPLWKLDVPAEGDPCNLAERNGLQCHRSNSGNLAEIRQLDRPGILKLKDQNGQDVYALLTGLTTQSATLRMGGVVQTVPLMSLARVWSGEYATLWRTPPGYTAQSTSARTGPTVDWLATQLARVSGAPAPAAGQNFDAALKARLQEFQVAQGLTADGVPGPKTLMHLNRAADIAEPRLTAEPAAN